MKNFRKRKRRIREHRDSPPLPSMHPRRGIKRTSGCLWQLWRHRQEVWDSLSGRKRENRNKQTAISFLCTTLAVQYIGSTPTAILGALEPLTAVFFGVTVFGESLTLRLCCGIILIILAVTLIIAGSNVTSHLVRFRKLFPRLPLKKKNAKS